MAPSWENEVVFPKVRLRIENEGNRAATLSLFSTRDREYSSTRVHGKLQDTAGHREESD